MFRLVVTTVLRVIHTNERNNRCYSRQGQRDWNVSRWIWIMYCELLVLSGAEKIHASRTKTDQYFIKPQPDEQMLWRAVYKLGKDMWLVTYNLLNRGYDSRDICSPHNRHTGRGPRGCNNNLSGSNYPRNSTVERVVAGGKRRSCALSKCTDISVLHMFI